MDRSTKQTVDVAAVATMAVNDYRVRSEKV